MQRRRQSAAEVQRAWMEAGPCSAARAHPAARPPAREHARPAAPVRPRNTTVRLARQQARQSVLELSTVSAHLLADVLEERLGDEPARVGVGRHSAWQVSAAREFEKFLGQQRRAILHLAGSATMYSRNEVAPL